ncbi:spore wall protein-1, partial [Stigmatella aurantiaca DW4/3-1]
MSVASAEISPAGRIRKVPSSSTCSSGSEANTMRSSEGGGRTSPDGGAWLDSPSEGVSACTPCGASEGGASGDPEAASADTGDSPSPSGRGTCPCSSGRSGAPSCGEGAEDNSSGISGFPSSPSTLFSASIGTPGSARHRAAHVTVAARRKHALAGLLLHHDLLLRTRSHHGRHRRGHLRPRRGPHAR